MAMRSRDDRPTLSPTRSVEPTHPALTVSTLFERYHQEVFRLCLGMLGDAQEAEDATQEVFLRAHRAWSTYDQARAAARTWIGHITMNYCRSLLRRRRASLLAQRLLGATAASENGSLDQRELRVDLSRALRQLDTDHRSVIVLRYYLDFSCAQIADVLKIKERTVHSRLYVARQRMQHAMQQEG